MKYNSNFGTLDKNIHNGARLKKIPAHYTKTKHVMIIKKRCRICKQPNNIRHCKIARDLHAFFANSLTNSLIVILQMYIKNNF